MRAARASDNPILDAAIIFGASALIAIAVDLLWHPEAIPLFAAHPYQTLVPCPTLRAEVAPIAAGDELLTQSGSMLIDARETEGYKQGHLTGARHVPYDYLDPTPEQVIRRLGREIAGSGARRVVVYGDGDDPDTGELLAKELAAQGLRHVLFVRGGYPALRAAGEAR